MKECKKEEIVYKRLCLEACGDILESLDVDRFDDLYNIVQNALAKVCYFNFKLLIFVSNEFDYCIIILGSFIYEILELLSKFNLIQKFFFLLKHNI